MWDARLSVPAMLDDFWQCVLSAFSGRFTCCYFKHSRLYLSYFWQLFY
jgi:hypothetical protein